MERLVEKVQALPSEKVVNAAQQVLTSVVLSSTAIVFLRSSLQALLSLLDEAQYDACDAALKTIDEQSVTSSNAVLKNRKALLEQGWLAEATRWCAPPSLADGVRMTVPVVLLRFTHDTIDSHFRNQQSLFTLFDELQRKTTLPEDLEEPLDICLHDNCFYSMSNRRLFVLLMYQVVHREAVVKAPCILRGRAWKNHKFAKAHTTANGGLGVDPHVANLQEALHRNRPIFDAGRSAKSVLEELLAGSQYEWLLGHVRLRDSLHQEDAHSLTLSNGGSALEERRSHTQKQPTQQKTLRAQSPSSGSAPSVKAPPPLLTATHRKPLVKSMGTKGSGKQLPRYALIESIFAILDIDGNGLLSSAEFRHLANVSGFEGSDAEWATKFQLLCEECLVPTCNGIDGMTFAQIVDGIFEMCYCTDDELLKYQEKLMSGKA